MIIPIMASSSDFIVKNTFLINNVCNELEYGRKNEIAVKSW